MARGFRLLTDIRPLRESPPFRRLWAGSLLSSTGGAMTSFAVTLQVFELTHSAFAVGALGAVRMVPTLGIGLLGGSLADSVDRRRLVLVTSGALALVSALFAAQAFAGVGQVWLLYLLTSAAASLSSVNGPAQRTFLPRLLPAGQLPAGLALNGLTFQLTMVAGPALAGLVTAGGGLRLCYVVDVASFAAALYAVSRLPAMPPHGDGLGRSVRAVAEGIRYIRANRPVAGAFLADLNATVLGLPVALFPAINAERFGGNPQTLGLLTAAIGQPTPRRWCSGARSCRRRYPTSSGAGSPPRTGRSAMAAASSGTWSPGPSARSRRRSSARSAAGWAPWPARS